MKIIVTGAGGFIGKRLVQHFSENHEVVAVSSRSDIVHLQNNDSSWEGATLIHSGFSVDYGAFKEQESESVRTTRLLANLAESRLLSHFIFLSAAGALGVSSNPRVRSESDVGTCDAAFSDYRNTQYIQDKLVCEQILNQKPFPVSILYLTTVYGPGMNQEILAPFQRKSLIRLAPPGGTSYLGMGDFLHFMDQLLSSQQTGRFVVSSGNISYSDLLKTRNAKHSRPLFVWTIPFRFRTWIVRFLDKLNGSRNTKHIQKAVVNSSFGFKYYSPGRAMRVLNWSPKETLQSILESALRQTESAKRIQRTQEALR